MVIYFRVYNTLDVKCITIRTQMFWKGETEVWFLEDFKLNMNDSNSI